MTDQLAFDAATFLLAWAVGGLGFLFVTGRRGEVGLGYGWLLRSIYAAVALGGLAAALRWPNESSAATAITATGCALVALAALLTLVASARRSVRAAASLSADAHVAGESVAGETVAGETVAGEAVAGKTDGTSEGGLLGGARPTSSFSPAWDLLAPLVGAPLLVVAALLQAASADLGIWDTTLYATRLVIGAAFVGVVGDSMLLGHWYLVQPGLRRAPLLELINWLLVLWPVEVAVVLLPTGMIDALTGTIDDGASGLLTWFWLACAASTGVLAYIAKLALRERAYSAVMAATGLLYLAILTGFGTDLVARLILTA